MMTVVPGEAWMMTGVPEEAWTTTEDLGEIPMMIEFLDGELMTTGALGETWMMTGSPGGARTPDPVRGDHL